LKLRSIKSLCLNFCNFPISNVYSSLKIFLSTLPFELKSSSFLFDCFIKYQSKKLKKMSRPRQVTVLVDKITFDPDDEVTQAFHPDQCCFYIMVNLETMAVLKPGDAPAKLILSEATLNDPNAVLRLLVKDHSMSQEGEPA